MRATLLAVGLVVAAGCGRSGVPVSSDALPDVPEVPFGTDGSSGVLDPQFSGDGLARAKAPGGVVARDIALTPEGDVLVLGTVSPDEEDADWMIVRLGRDGNRVGSFGDGGKMRVDLGGIDVGGKLLVEPGGHFLVSGFSLPLVPGGGPDRIVVKRFDAAGVADSGFATAGSLWHALDSPEMPALIHRTSDGSFYLASSDTSGAGTRYIVERLTAQGLLDVSYGVAQREAAESTAWEAFDRCFPSSASPRRKS